MFSERATRKIFSLLVAKELNSWIVLIFNYHNRALNSNFPHSLETRDARVERPYRTDMETSTIYQQLIELFPNPRVVQKVLLDYPNERDMSRLVTYALNEPSHWLYFCIVAVFFYIYTHSIFFVEFFYGFFYKYRKLNNLFIFLFL